MSTAKRNPGEPTAKHPGDSPQQATPTGGASASKRPPGQASGPTTERHEPAAASGYVSQNGRSKRIVIGLVLLALAAGGAYAWYHHERASADQRQLALQGNIDVRQVNLAFKVDGRIASLAVDEGDSVKAGQVIATLDKKYFDDDLRVAKARRDNAKASLARLEHGSRPEEIASAKAQVAEQRATLTRSEQDFERAERLVGQGAVSRETFDQARSALDEARGPFEVRRRNRAHGRYRPATGRHRCRPGANGRARGGRHSVRAASGRQRVSRPQRWRHSHARPRDRGHCRRQRNGLHAHAGVAGLGAYLCQRTGPGTNSSQHARQVTTDSAPDKIYQGRIGFISPVAEFTPKTVETRELRTNLVYRLRVLVDNPDNGLRQGMPVTVSLDLTARD